MVPCVLNMVVRGARATGNPDGISMLWMVQIVNAPIGVQKFAPHLFFYVAPR